MKKSLNRLFSSILAAIMLVGTASFADVNTISVGVLKPLEAFAAESYITEEGGWFESAYVEWTSVPNATGFAAYVKGANEPDSAYAQLDNELIRKYPTYFRADAVGLKAGEYVIKVVPYINGDLDESKAFVTGTLDVKAYDRSGFAFSSNSPFKTASGAYNDDGTLKSNAKVFYVTKDTAKTISTDVVINSKGGTSTYTGLQAIITAKQKGYDTTPYDFRIIGTIEAEDMDGFDSSEEGLQVKGRNSYSEMNITIEGIGEDAGIRNFGILIRNAGNVELRNFAVMLCMDDSISLDTDNTNIWIHNLDLFYGQEGSAADQIKGDGTIDIKGDSQYITVSYNHLYDCGKASLCGMNETSPNYITYHHNWFDHSDSRHPRIRTMSVHVYNNYYDGNSKYGIGTSSNSSAFVESNYFVDCKYPTLQGGMGHDNDGNGGSNMFTDSSPTGVIKFYNNKLTGTYQFTPDNKNTISNPAGDAYVVETRDEVVPSTYKTTLGATYSNFDTNSSIDLGVDLADITPVDDVPSVVMANAGRMNGGDFFETTGTSRSDYIGLTSSTYDASDHVLDDVLKAAITNYTPTLVSVGGLTTGGTVDTTASTESTTEPTTSESTTEPTTSESTTEPTTAKTYDLNAGDLTAAVYSSSFEYNEFVINATAEKTIEVINKSASVGNVTASQAISLGGAGTADYRSVTFTTDGAAAVSIIAQSTGDDERVINIADAKTDEVVATVNVVNKSGNVVLETVELSAAGTYYIASANKGMYLYYVSVSEKEASAYLWGDFNNNGELAADDAAAVLQHVLNNSYMPAEEKILYYIDVDGNNAIDAADAAQILQKVLNASYKFLVEE